MGWGRLSRSASEIPDPLHGRVNLLILVVAGGGLVAATSATTITPAELCGAVEACANNTLCSACTNSVLASTGRGSDDRAELRLAEVEFFFALNQSAACAMVPPDAMLAVFEAAHQQLPCANRLLHYVSACQVAEFLCFNETEMCRPCLTRLYNMTGPQSFYAAPSGSAAAFHTAPCEHFFLQALEFDLAEACTNFPKCSVTKYACQLPNVSGECEPAVELLQNGRVQEAIEAVPGPGFGADLLTSLELLDLIVRACTWNLELSCEYFQLRCQQMPYCRACYDAMNGAVDIVGGMSSPACTALRAVALTNSTDTEMFTSLEALFYYFDYCPYPTVTQCAYRQFTCAVSDALCVSCMNGTAEHVSRCDLLLGSGETGFDVATSCTPCSSTVNLINTLTLATSVVGAVAIVGCLVVLAVIIAHGKMRHALRERIIMGLMMANLVFSTANTVPIGLLHYGATNCGRQVLTFEATRGARALWLGGKYAVGCYECFILAASLWAILRSRSGVPQRVETAMHVMCAVLGTAALVGFYLRCREINNSGYNAATQAKGEDNSRMLLRLDDDLDDDEAGIEALLEFQSARNQYDTLVQTMLRVWLGLLGVSMILWVTLRALFQSKLKSWRNLVEATEAEYLRDPWVHTRKGELKEEQALLAYLKQMYLDVARPLEPYVAVFVLFGGPAALMATDWCLDRSGARSDKLDKSDFSRTTKEPGHISFGTCFAWCELALAFRSLACVAVYFAVRKNRVDLARLRRAIRAAVWPTAECDSNEPLVPLAAAALCRDDNTAITESWHIRESDISLVTMLAEGSYGEVWEGTWAHRPGSVAIKVMKRAIGDEEVDPFAEGDFNRECEILKSIRHPHLLQFFGYGITSTNRGFIVTEIMAFGSLRHIIADTKQPFFEWDTRTQIALQIAKGMQHLHSIPIVHRDLKSDNCLIDDRLVAKVCDFGTSRLIDRRPPRIFYCPFTGESKRAATVAATNGVEAPPEDQLTEDIASLTVAIVDKSGSMTRAAGTLLWMAPEVFRGAQNYGTAVDVFSFGLIMWEIAMRAEPWSELTVETDMELFLALEGALQSGKRPHVSDEAVVAHGGYVNVLEKCWAGDPSDRPTFDHVVHMLGEVVTAELKSPAQYPIGRRNTSTATAGGRQWRKVLPGRNRKTSESTADLNEPLLATATSEL